MGYKGLFCRMGEGASESARESEREEKSAGNAQHRFDEFVKRGEDLGVRFPFCTFTRVKYSENDSSVELARLAVEVVSLVSVLFRLATCSTKIGKCKRRR